MQSLKSAGPKKARLLCLLGLTFVLCGCLSAIFILGLSAIDDHSNLYRAEANFVVLTPVSGVYSGHRLYIVVDDGGYGPIPKHQESSISKTVLADAAIDAANPKFPKFRLATVDEVKRLGLPCTKTLKWDGATFRYQVAVHGEEIGIDYSDDQSATSCSYHLRGRAAEFTYAVVLRDSTAD